MQCSAGWLIYHAGFRTRATSPFCFGKSDQNHFLRVRGTTGNWSTAPNQDGSETRSAQTVLAGGADSGWRPSRAQRREIQIPELQKSRNVRVALLIEKKVF